MAEPASAVSMTDRIRNAGGVAWAVVGLAALLTLVGVVGYWLRVIFPPLVLAGAIVFILNPVVTLLQRKGVPRAAGTGLCYLGVVGLAVLAGFAVAPLARDQVDELVDDWPEIRDSLEVRFNDFSDWTEENGWFPVTVPKWDEIGNEFNAGDQGEESFTEQLNRAREIGLRVFEVGIIIVLGPIIAFYLLVDLPHIRKVMDSLVPDRARDEVEFIGRRLNRAIGGFFRGQLMVACIVGVMVSVGLAILDLPFWLIVGMIAGAFNLIPLIGPWVGAVPGIVIALTTRDFGTALWVAGIMTVAQQIDNHFISPLVMQRAVRLHPAVVMMALLAGGTLGGFFGLLLAVPLTAVLKILVGHLWRTYVLDQALADQITDWDDADTKAAVGIVEKIGDEDEDYAGADSGDDIGPTVDPGHGPSEPESDAAPGPEQPAATGAAVVE